MAMARSNSTPRLFVLLLAFLGFASLTLASSPASFCKCTCFSNSTIIPLDQPKSRSLSEALYLLRRSDSFEEPENELEERAPKYRALSCNDCTRKFCLSYNLPTCKGAKEDDVVTTCFQRDSKKDEAIVFIFIFATSGLLGWALFKPWVEKYLEAARERRSYIPVSGN
ncbi:hypothetical protein BDW42DRAFT_165921 [Aspergillus taichungensis]|uniref:Uncharacterized protein n=1 Tax=Aspergillus taichungensis TaxID=482145 RepID=A0A2J5HZI9_9EURO|nr:hypothetical protein BDW42DRAFT_165921 [Aspergillus taichungensis]